jgi:hypothetical protein
MSDTKLFIVPIAVDIVNGKYHTIVIEDNTAETGISLPYVINNTSEDIELQIQECILNYIRVNPSWLKINLYNKIRNRNNCTEIFYYFSLPYDAMDVVDQNKVAIINFDVICLNDSFLCNLKYRV